MRINVIDQSTPTFIWFDIKRKMHVDNLKRCKTCNDYFYVMYGANVCYDCKITKQIMGL